jgi:two-component system, NarL family, response regulator NreC
MSETSEKKIKLMVVDDQQIITQGLMSLLNDMEGLDKTILAHSAKEAEDMVLQHNPDVVLMDYHMPDMNGIETTRYLLKKYSQLRIIMLTGFDDISLVREALQAGARGYVLKNIHKSELIRAIHAVYEGYRFLDYIVLNKIVDDYLSRPDQHRIQPGDISIDFLTSREIEILQHIAAGETSQQIADTLFISTNTVDTHRKNLLSKCGVKNTAELIQFAAKNNLLGEQA